MRFNFRKISALATSALMLGWTAGVAAAASYPAPFVVGGTADVAIVYGTGSGVSALDAVQAGNVQTNLQSFMTGTTGGTATTTTGEIVSLDTSATRIWLNTSLDVAKSSLTKSNLPTTLSETTFSGDVEAKLTHTIKFIAGNTGAASGTSNTGTVIFAKQPKTSTDPSIGISMGSSATSYALYNASATFNKAVNFTDSASEGESITLFGQTFTVAAATDSTDLVLLKEAEKMSLTSDAPSEVVTIGGETYTVTLVSASDTAATVKVTDSSGASDSKEINEAASKKIQGLEISVNNADETNLLLSATVIAGSEKVTLTNGNTVTTGSDSDDIDGTTAHIVGGTTATTEIAITISRPDSSSDAIVAGAPYVDPVFGSFKFDFAGMSSPLDDSNREALTVGLSGDDTMTLTMTSDDSETGTFDFARNNSGTYYLGDDSNFAINTVEMANLTEDTYIILGNEDYGHLLRVDRVSNSSSSTPGSDVIKFTDVLSGDVLEATSPTTEGSTTLDVDGKQYTVTYQGPGSASGSGGSVQLKYPTSDSAAGEYVVYPTIKTEKGALVSLYEQKTLTLADMDGIGTDATALKFPDGDGYTTLSLSHTADNTLTGNSTGIWNLSGASVNAISINTSDTESTGNFTIGQLTYQIAGSATNSSIISLIDPEDVTPSVTGPVISNPAIIVFEGKDDSNNYEAFVITTETPAGTSDDGAGVEDVLFSSPTHYDALVWQSDSDMSQHVDWWGTSVVVDSGDSDQKVASVSYPASQIYAQIYVGETDAAVSSSTTTGTSAQLGDVIVLDTEVSSVQSKNLIVVGGSCINSVAANLVGGALCGSAWTDATGVGSGQFLIESYGDAYTTGKVALLVAGYDAADTVNAATYLRTQTVDTAASMKYLGTSSTSAELQVA